jgi:putative hydrolase of HD superfamily
MTEDYPVNADPSASDADPDAAGIAQFVFEMGVLKRLRRAGWWHVGVRDPESVAEHSLRVAQIASLIAAEEGADPARAAFLAIWHDSQETRTGDIPHTAKPYLNSIDNNAVTADQVRRMPETARKTVQEAVTEYEGQSSPEAQCAKDADKLECLIQALEYRAAGYAEVQGWIDSSYAALRTITARRIADAAQMTSTLAWRDR